MFLTSIRSREAPSDLFLIHVYSNSGYLVANAVKLRRGNHPTSPRKPLATKRSLGPCTINLFFRRAAAGWCGLVRQADGGPWKRSGDVGDRQKKGSSSSSSFFLVLTWCVAWSQQSGSPRDSGHLWALSARSSGCGHPRGRCVSDTGVALPTVVV